MTAEPNADNSNRAMPAVPIRWDTLTTDTAQRELGQLTTWVTRLVERYDLDSRAVPTCWRQHGALVEELSALHTAWLSSYALTSPGNAPLAWHATFAACRTRMSEYTARSGCTATRHREKGQPAHRPSTDAHGAAHGLASGPAPSANGSPGEPTGTADDCRNL